MTDEFDKAYWEEHWRQGLNGGAGSMGGNPPNPYLADETHGLAPGTALDAGCGAGAEAIWLASRGWQVTAADISSEALSRAADRAEASGVSDRVRWVEADLSVWEPGASFDLVTTHYAHPAIPQLEFYERLAAWVAPGGTLLIVGHLHTDDAPGGAPGHGHGHDGHGHDGHGHDGHGDHPRAAASVTAEGVRARLDEGVWEVVTAEERRRTLPGPGGRAVPLQDVVVRATRRT
jgi:SAM-dependent methyltransferase